MNTISMKRFAAGLMIAATVAGCQKPNDTTTIQSRGDANPRSQGHTGSTTSVNGISYNGKVTASASYQDLFNDLVRGFMEASVPKEYVGYVSATGANNTGVLIGGRIELANGQALRSTNSNVAIAANSQLIVGVFDYWPNQTDVPLLPPTYFREASGTINGNTATIRFTDSFGYVELRGTFDNNNFTGDFYFSTEKVYDRSRQGDAGTMGRFQVPTCQFFRCN